MKCSDLPSLALSTRRKQEREALLDVFSGDLCHEISEEVVVECIKETATSEIQ